MPNCFTVWENKNRYRFNALVLGAAHCRIDIPATPRTVLDYKHIVGSEK